MCSSVCLSICVCVCPLQVSLHLFVSPRLCVCVSLSDSHSLSHTVCLCFPVSRSSYLPAAPSLPACSGTFPCKVPTSHSLSFPRQAGYGGALARLGLCLSLAVREKKATSGPKSGVPPPLQGRASLTRLLGAQPPPGVWPCLGDGSSGGSPAQTMRGGQSLYPGGRLGEPGLHSEAGHLAAQPPPRPAGVEQLYKTSCF